jgi:ribose 5-phosphate isomerase B
MGTVFLGCDHGGFALKREVIGLLQKLSLPMQDLGCECEEISVHYPHYAYKVVQAILTYPGSRGILICGTGLGMSIAANRFPGIRAALCQELYTARMSRLHNDANLLVMGGRIVGPGLAREIVNVWLHTSFEGGRHQERLNLIDTLPTHFQEHP